MNPNPTRRQLDALKHLYSEETCSTGVLTVQGLANLMGLSKTSTWHHLRGLLAKGLVEKSESGYFCYVVSDAGRDLLYRKNYEPSGFRRLELAWREASEKERKRFLKAVKGGSKA